MPAGRIEVNLQHHGTDLRAVSRDLKSMTDARVGQLFKRHLETAARPYPARARASALSIPVKEEGQHTGLRARIAQCVTVSSGVDGREAWLSLWIDVRKMLPDYMTLPLYMQGVVAGPKRRYDRWRHPVYGNREVWRGQPAHPYFYQAVDALGRSAEGELQKALAEVTRELRG